MKNSFIILFYFSYAFSKPFETSMVETLMGACQLDVEKNIAKVENVLSIHQHIQEVSKDLINSSLIALTFGRFNSMI